MQTKVAPPAPDAKAAAAKPAIAAQASAIQSSAVKPSAVQATATAATAATAAKTAAAAGQPAMPQSYRRRYELLDECREMMIGKLSTALNEAMEKVNDKLIEDADSMDDQTEAMWREAAQVVMQNKLDIEKKFRRAFNDVFERRLFSRPEPSTEPQANQDGELVLSLVSEEAIDDKMTVEKLVKKSKSRLSADEVLGIRARLGALLERDWFEEDKQPASPYAVLEALRSTLAELSANRQVTAALLEAIEPFLTNNLNQVYTQVNQRLVAHSILPKIKQVVQVNSNARRPAEAGKPGQDPGAEGAVAGRGAFAAGDLAAGAAVGYGDLLRGGALDNLMDSLSRGVPAARMQAARLLTDEAAFASEDLALPDVAASVLEALSQIQLANASMAQAGPISLEAMRGQVQEKGSPLDSLTVDIVEMVFDYVYSDHRLPDTLKQQLLRLQVVAVKAALIDRSFFAKRQHPLRRFLDRITEIGGEPDLDVSPQSGLVVGVTGIVDGIVKEFVDDLSLFDGSLEKLEALYVMAAAESEQRIASEAAKGESEETRSMALDESRQALADRIDQQTPDFLREFLLATWTEVMAKAKLATTPVLSPEQTLQLAEQLVWSVGPKQASTVKKLAGMLPPMITGIVKGLTTVEFSKEARERFFNELMQVHTQAIAAARASAPVAQANAAAAAAAPIQMNSAGELKFMPRNDQGPAVEPTRSLRDNLLEDLVKGVHIDVLEDSGEALRYKLAWVSPNRKLFLLSRHPNDPVSLSRNDIAAWLESGKARIALAESIVDRAIDIAAAGPKLSQTVAA